MMNNLWNNQGLWAMLGAVFGGTLLAVVNKMLGKPREKFDLGAAIRNEIRKDNLEYRKEIDELNRRLDSWSRKYYEMDQKHKQKITELEETIEAMQRVLIKNGIDYPVKK